MRKVYGIDLGGTTTKFGLFSEDGHLLDAFAIPTDTSEKGKNILKDISKAIQENLQKHALTTHEIHGIGIGVPGPVSGEGVVLKCVNLGWEIMLVKNNLEALTGIETHVGNDANVAVLGEVWQGSGKGYKNAVMVTLGTGVGGGILINGKIVNGANGAGGEIGHIHVNDAEHHQCGCGKKGCLEQYASATGLVRSANALLGNDPRQSVLRDMKALTAEMIFDAAKNKDEVAIELVEGFGAYLGKALANISCTIDADVFIIGGGVSNAGQIITDTIGKYYIVFAFHASKNTPFVLARLGNKAGIYGAAGLILTE